MTKSKNYRQVEEMITNIKSHVSAVYVIVKKDGDNDTPREVGSFIVENCGLFHPARILFHFNPNSTPSECEEWYIREVVCVDMREGHNGYRKAIVELCNRITPKFMTLWGRKVKLNTSIDILDAVKSMDCWVVQAI